jgi:hypothetical protein
MVWVGYGVLLTAAPIITANLLLIAAASWSWHRRRRSRSSIQ